MLLTLSTTHQPATDLGFLLHKHPDRFQTVKLSVGKAHVFYPVSSEKESEVALLLDIDPVELARSARRLPYVNDRPYVASSFLSTAISKAFRSALNGTCDNRPELVNTAIPLTARISVLPAPKGGDSLIRRLFVPLGYTVKAERHQLDTANPEWGESKYYTVEISGTVKLSELLTHLYVLVPVLDNEKHYYVSEVEVEKLLKRGEGWLEDHPEREQIVRRYLLDFRSLTRVALPEEDMTSDKEKKQPLHELRLDTVLGILVDSGASSVLDLGCGEGKLIRKLLKHKQFRRIAGTDVSYSELMKAKERLHYAEMSPMQRDRLELFQGSLTYRDERLNGYDAAAVVEVIEHLDEGRLKSFERVVFACARPGMVIITTPNGEYNALYPNVSEGKMRHADHRFEWTRAEFASWAEGVAQTHGYSVTTAPLGPLDDIFGAPSQLATFIRNDTPA